MIKNKFHFPSIIYLRKYLGMRRISICLDTLKIDEKDCPKVKGMELQCVLCTFYIHFFMYTIILR